MRSSAPKCFARSLAVVSPTWRMPSAYRKRASVVCLLLLQRRHQVDRALLAHAVQRRQLGHAQRVQLGQRADQTAIDQLVDDLVAQAFDVHRAAAGEVQQAPACAARRRTGRRCSGGRCRPSRAARRCRTPGRRAACGSSARRPARAPGTRPTTSGITSPARRTITVSPTRTPLRRSSNTLCSVALLTVVPPTNTGSSLATGVSLPVRPTWMSMPRSVRHLLLRRVLVRHRPARLARDEAQPLLQRHAVDLVDDAVDVERQRVALRTHRLVEGDQPGRTLRHRAVGAHRQPEGRQRVQRAAVRGRLLPALQFAQPVGEEAQRPLRGDGRVELAHRAGRGVARVDEGLLALVALERRSGARSRRGACRPRRALPAPGSR